jgi:hypothetical protein
VEYSAEGIAVSDFNIQYWIGRIQTETKVQKAQGAAQRLRHIKFSTSNIIHAIRLEIKKQTIPHKNLMFYYKGDFFYADENGRITNWPDGFADIYDKILEGLI